MDREETVALWRQGREVWNSWAADIFARGKELSGAGRWQIDDEGEGRNEETRKWVADASVDFSGLRFVTGAHLDKKRSEPQNEEQEPFQPDAQTLFVEGQAIDFGGLSFPWLANFERAEFRGEAWFWGTAFNGEAKFQDAKFLEKAVFEGAQFYRPVWFARDQMMFLQSTKATFGVTSYRSWKHGFDPEGDHTPHAAEFYAKAEFINAQFHNWSWFGNVKFHDTVRFNDVQFNLTGFNSAEFKDAVFVRVEFKEQADFSSAKFNERGTFNDAKFLGITEFGRVRFDGHAEFEHAHFHDEARFSNAQFNGEATFWSTQFAGWTTFEEGQFQKEVNFKYVRFQERVNFRNTKFYAASWFAGTTFQTSTSFREAKFGTKEIAADADFTGVKVERDFDMTRAEFFRVPAFNQADFKQAPDLDNVKFPLPSFWRGGNPELIAQYRAIRRMAIQGADYEREQMAFKGELRSRRWTVDKWGPALWLGLFYDGVADCGRSILRPLSIWLVSILVFAAIYLRLSDGWTCGAPFVKALFLSGRNALVLFSGARDARIAQAYQCLFGGNPEPDIPDSVSFIESFVQVPLSAVLIFLFLLAVKNRFKIK